MKNNRLPYISFFQVNNCGKAFIDVFPVNPTLEKLKQLPIKKSKDNLVRLSDVANIEFGPVSEKALFRAQSKKALNLKTVGIGIYARSGASTVELSKEIKKKLRK